MTELDTVIEYERRVASLTLKMAPVIVAQTVHGGVGS